MDEKRGSFLLCDGGVAGRIVDEGLPLLGPTRYPANASALDDDAMVDAVGADASSHDVEELTLTHSFKHDSDER